MNFLAHAYLSFNHPEALVGNLISDFVKGKKKFEYPPGIQKGIALHRAIDRFTDDHELTKMAKAPFRPAYRLYSAAFIDIVYDHFLATDKNEFPGESLQDFTKEVYAVLRNYSPILPPMFQKMLPYMQAQNWLYNYRFRWGIERSFAGLVRRSAWLTESDTAFLIFNENYTTLQGYYQSFIGSLKLFARHEFEKLYSS